MGEKLFIQSSHIVDAHIALGNHRKKLILPIISQSLQLQLWIMGSQHSKILATKSHLVSNHKHGHNPITKDIEDTSSPKSAEASLTMPQELILTMVK